MTTSHMQFETQAINILYHGFVTSTVLIALLLVGLYHTCPEYKMPSF
jgi:hypothetical protein